MRGYSKTDHKQHVSYDLDHITENRNMRASKNQLPTTMFVYFGALGQR